MTFTEYARARQLLAEEQVGKPLRAYRAAQAAREDRSLAKLRADTQRDRAQPEEPDAG